MKKKKQQKIKCKRKILHKKTVRVSSCEKCAKISHFKIFTAINYRKKLFVQKVKKKK